MNLVDINSCTFDVQKIVTIDWGSAPKPRAVITLVDGQRIALTHEETAAFRWYLERIWRPLDLIDAYRQWQAAQEKRQEPAAIPEVDREAFLRR